MYFFQQFVKIYNMPRFNYVVLDKALRLFLCNNQTQIAMVTYENSQTLFDVHLYISIK